MAQVTDTYMTFQFLKRLTTPFNKMKAYEMGLIDENGNRIKKAQTKEEKDALTYFDRLVLNLKRLLAKVPGGSSRFANYAAALYLVKESVDPKEHYSEEEMMDALVENMLIMEKTSMKNLKELLEDAPANATGAAVAGTGDTGDAWKMDARNKKTKAFLRRYMESKGKREAIKKRKDFMKQLGL
jgi:hypothetical protein